MKIWYSPVETGGARSFRWSSPYTSNFYVFHANQATDVEDARDIDFLLHHLRLPDRHNTPAVMFRTSPPPRELNTIEAMQQRVQHLGNVMDVLLEQNPELREQLGIELPEAGGPAPSLLGEL